MRSETSHGEPAGGSWLLGMCFFSLPLCFLFFFSYMEARTESLRITLCTVSTWRKSPPSLRRMLTEYPGQTCSLRPGEAAQQRPGYTPSRARGRAAGQRLLKHTHTQIISQLAASSQLITPESGALRSRSPELAKSRVRAALKKLPASQPRAAAAELSAGLYGRV